jgi:2-succinyl-5-enolpyruvyl-6-hydroxy-3-cyclohexene-1-carboxylate synthase
MPDFCGTAALNLRWARTLVDALAAAGVRHAVISPGSRSTPLALACARALTAHVIVDERSAAYFALGMAKAGGAPVALVCTSGTAVANWMPAVVEANHARVPLILLSADRPREIQGFGANQTIDQNHLFGAQVRAYHGLPEPDASALPALRAIAARALEQSLWPMPGPVHVNVPLREPLVPMADDLAQPAPAWQAIRFAAPRLEPDPDLVHDLAARMSGGRGLIVCGAGLASPETSLRSVPPEGPSQSWGGPAIDLSATDEVARLAAALGVPILADPLSNLRRGPHDRGHIACRYDAFLRHPSAQAMRPDWVLRLGAMPVSKLLQQYLAAANPALHVLVDAHGAWPDPLQSITHMVRTEPARLCRALLAHAPSPAPAAWLRGFLELEQHGRPRWPEGQEPPEAWVVAELARALPEGATLFSGNSMAIRELDSFLDGDARALRVLANRGASGIDGNVSTLAGIAALTTYRAGADRIPARPVAGLIGDLALHHDLNGLHTLRGRDAVLVVLNNGGGGIFKYLPQAGLEDFERLWRTPVATDFAHAARAFGLPHARVNERSAFAVALDAALAQGGPHVIEVMIDADESVARHRAWWDTVARLE